MVFFNLMLLILFIVCEEILKIIKGDKIKEEDFLKIVFSIGRKILFVIN